MTRRQIEITVAWGTLVLATAAAATFATTTTSILVLAGVTMVVWAWVNPIQMIPQFIAYRKRKNEKKAAKNV